MNDTPKNSLKSNNLRNRAEDFLQKTPSAIKKMPSKDFNDLKILVEELQIHQVELEMQNDELRHTQTELEASKLRYFDFYNLAPVGYFTVSEKGLILEANLTSATLLGLARGALAKQPITRFIFKKDQDIYYLHRKQLFESEGTQACDLRMVKMDGTLFWAHLILTMDQDGDNGPVVCRIVMSDITDRKRTENAVKESEEKFRLLYEKAPLGYQSLDEHGHFLEVNQAWLDTLVLRPKSSDLVFGNL